MEIPLLLVSPLSAPTVFSVLSQMRVPSHAAFLAVFMYETCMMM